MPVHNKIIQDMLGNINDPKMRSVYGRIISGDIVKQIECWSDNCKGRVIATVDSKGAVEETPPVVDPEGKNGIYSSGLEGSRQRFDGQIGFRCYCGNNSILCEEEKGVITPARPSMEDLEKIAERLERRKPNLYPVNKGKQNVDGFVIKDVKV